MLETQVQKLVQVKIQGGQVCPASSHGALGSVCGIEHLGSLGCEPTSVVYLSCDARHIPCGFKCPFYEVGILNYTVPRFSSDYSSAIPGIFLSMPSAISSPRIALTSWVWTQGGTCVQIWVLKLNLYKMKVQNHTWCVSALCLYVSLPFCGNLVCKYAWKVALQT